MENNEQQNLFIAGLNTIKFQIEKEYEKKVEILEIFFDYKIETVQQYYKFENDNNKYSTGAESLKTDKDSRTLSEMFVEGIQKKLRNCAEMRFASIIFNLKENEIGIKKTELYYFDSQLIPRHFDSEKDDSYNQVN